MHSCPGTIIPPCTMSKTVNKNKIQHMGALRKMSETVAISGEIMCFIFLYYQDERQYQIPY